MYSGVAALPLATSYLFEEYFQLTCDWLVDVTIFFNVSETGFRIFFAGDLEVQLVYYFDYFVQQK